MSNEKYVLVVDDDTDLLNQLAKDLTTGGFIAVTASRAGEAVTKLKNQRFDCILIDLNLDKNSGLKVINLIRHPNAANSFNYSTPIIIMSGFLKPETIRETKELVQAILAKPFGSASLIEKVRSVIDGRVTIAQEPDRSPKTDSDDDELIHALAGILAKSVLTLETLKDLCAEKGGPEVEIIEKLEQYYFAMAKEIAQARRREG